MKQLTESASRRPTITSAIGAVGSVVFVLLAVGLALPVPDDLAWQYDHWRSGEADPSYFVEYLGPSAVSWVLGAPFMLPVLAAIAISSALLAFGALCSLRNRLSAKQ